MPSRSKPSLRTSAGKTLDCPPKNLHKTSVSDLKICAEEKKVKISSSGKKGPIKKDYIVALKVLKKTHKKTASKSKPTYKTMIIQSILANTDRKGASRQFIKAYVSANYPSVNDEVLKAYIKRTLKKLVVDGSLEMNGVRYKISKKEKKLLKPKVKEPKVKVTKVKEQKVKVTKAKKPKVEVPKRTTGVTKPRVTKQKSPVKPKTPSLIKPKTPSPVKQKSSSKKTKTPEYSETTLDLYKTFSTKDYVVSAEDLKEIGEKGGGKLVCYGDDIGGRKMMEDSAFFVTLGENVSLYAILDGHGPGDSNNEATKHFVKLIPRNLYNSLKKVKDLYNKKEVTEAIQKCFLKLDEDWWTKNKENRTGTTFTGLLQLPKKFYTINIGDSRIVIKQGSKLFTTKDSDILEDKGRILKAGHTIAHLGTWRIEAGGLAVSRALGDNHLKSIDGKYAGKKAAVLPIPDVECYTRKGNERIVLACDGIFDELTSEEVVSEKFFGCEKMIKEATIRGSTDNKTVICLQF